MKLRAIGAALAALCCTTAVAEAQSRHPPGSLGGGFIEFLVTGRSGPSGGGRMATSPAAMSPPVTPLAPAESPSKPREAAWGAPNAPSPAAFPSSRQPRAWPDHVPPGADLPMRRAALVQPAPQASPLKREISPEFRRQTVPYSGPHKPGTIVIDTKSRHLFLVEAGGTAIRYGIGVGRPGFGWSGRKTVSMKREWPDWRPPAEMLKRRPDLPTWLAGGIDNPLGARALYLGSSLYRIHGTNEPHTIGQAVSSGCFRMTNDDVVDLYGRVRVGTPVVVI
jgi:lipoprotein-anchoring transpeptidase ErfK/SrfK